MNSKTETLYLLLVDDDPADRQLVKLALAKSSQSVQFNIETAETLSEATEQLSHNEYDIVLLDLGLPDSQGMETVQKAHKTNPNLPIVVLTGLDNEEVGLEAIRSGAEDYLTKGKSLEYALVRTIRYAIERKQAKMALSRNENLLRTIINATKEAMLSIDNNGLINLFNPAAEKMFGYKRENVLGQSLDYLLSPEYRQQHQQYLKEYFATGKPDAAIGNTIELTALRSNGEEFPIELSLSTGTLVNKRFVIAVGRDITERKQAELKQAELLRKVENINKELKDFASIVSHDLKAPLRGIKTLANWILSDCGDNFSEDGKEQMDLLLARVERMYALIDGMLTYSRIGRAEGKQTQVNLETFMPEIIDMVVPPENIKVTIEGKLPVIESEEIHIMQLFQNLLSNAIKYMDKPQGQIKINCAEEDDFWKFSIADNGPGIQEKDFDKIFKMFQALSTSEEFQGTGVGLTVTKKIVELYGGKIWIESKVGEGSTFFFTLPKKEIEINNAKLEANTTC
ncbi:MAG: ATP-binding protein [Phycisphaerales bacterium]|jgi:PAS domain S-box-containing protein